VHTFSPWLQRVLCDGRGKCKSLNAVPHLSSSHSIRVEVSLAGIKDKMGNDLPTGLEDLRVPPPFPKNWRRQRVLAGSRENLCPGSEEMGAKARHPQRRESKVRGWCGAGGVCGGGTGSYASWSLP